MQLKYFLSLFLCFLLILSATACGRASSANESTSSANGKGGKAPAPVCPFSDMNWESAADDVITAEGNDFSIYDSVYGGTCYTFPKEYEGRHGTIKYMFDDENKLMCVAWAYGCSDTEELLALYETISASVDDIYGKTSRSAEHPGNYGNVWYLESGDIVLATMITADNKALQYAYLHPLVSNRAHEQDSSENAA